MHLNTALTKKRHKQRDPIRESTTQNYIEIRNDHICEINMI